MLEPRYVPFAVAAPEQLIDDDGAVAEPSGEIVGADDAAADAARTGADVDLSHANRDSDGVPIGAADVEADRQRAAGDG
ncbi:hypothetical protein AB0A95_10720 [Micromonospora sp. NPDC049230]|uniref:hypothetical protein n=1 Tax=Micromonospora sp. NPDC049230 TaxID=3155502 RepID=UPI0033E5C72B